MSSTIRDDLKSFRRTWVHHTGMQLATLTVLAATFTVVVFVIAMSLNVKRVLAYWGEGVRMSVYLTEDSEEGDAQRIRKELSSLPEVKAVTFVSREAATASFKTQMASYAPDLLSDADFATPFPLSLRVSLKSNVVSEEDVAHLESLASTIGAIQGVEDVSYGQSWMRSYSSFVNTLNASGGVMILILLAGSLLVVGNSVRSSIATRRDEIEILELVGATSNMIRRPFVFEGFVMGGVASVIALSANFGAFVWQKSVISSSFALARLSAVVGFLQPSEIAAFIVVGALFGALGAWLTVRGINDGWSAVRRVES